MDKYTFMNAAIEEAKRAMAMGEVPVGAVIVRNDEIIASAHNMRENGGGATAHAELMAIESACKALGGWRLSDCTLYVTLEPCPMCAGAIINARLGRVVFGAKDPRGGAFGSVLNMNAYPLGYKADVEYGVREAECLLLLRDFFKHLRDGGDNVK